MSQLFSIMWPCSGECTIALLLRQNRCFHMSLVWERATMCDGVGIKQQVVPAVPILRSHAPVYLSSESHTTHRLLSFRGPVPFGVGGGLQ